MLEMDLSGRRKRGRPKERFMSAVKEEVGGGCDKRKAQKEKDPLWQPL